MEIRKIIRIIFIFCVLIGVTQNRELLAQCSTVPVQEAVINGDFEKGYLTNNGTTYSDGSPRGFKSEYTPVADFTGSNCVYGFGDRYGIATNLGPSGICGANFPYIGAGYPGSVPFRDHTPGKGGNGFALLVDFFSNKASTSLYTGGKPVAWAQDVNVFPGQNYYFSSWFANYTSSPGSPTLYFVVTPYDASNTLLTGSRQVIGTASPTGIASWQQFYGQWTPSGSFTKVQISIEVDFSLAGNDPSSGADFMFDDISFINGCQNLASLRVPKFPSDTINLCSSSGSINLTATYAGDPNPSNNVISWFRGNTSPQTDVTSSSSGLSFNNITAPDTYRICITDPDNSPGTCPVSATVVVLKQMDVTLPPTSLCSPAVVNITANVSPTGAYTKNYTWTVPSGVTNPGNNATVTANLPGNYSVTVTNPNLSGCSGTANVSVTSLLPTYDGSKIQPLCYGATNQTITGLGTGANVANYKWYTTSTGGTAFSTGASPTIPGPLPTSGASYTIYLEDATTTPVGGSPIVPNGTTQGVATYSQNLTVHQSLQLVSVQTTPSPWTGQCISAAGTYNYRVELTNAAGTTVLQYRDVTMNCGSNTAQTLTLNFNIAPGSYQLRIRNAGGAAPTGWYNYYNSTGTYSIPGYIDVTDGNNFGAPFGRYTIVKSNGCDRVPITFPLQDCCTPATITTQPANTSVCPNTAASFNVAATIASGTLSYQWQSDNGTSGATWTNVASATTATLNIPAASVTNTINGYRYRVIIRVNGTCPDTSNVATLTVRPLPNVTSPTTATVCSGESFNYTPTSNIAGSTFSWTRAVVTNINNTAGSGTGNINEMLVNTSANPVNVTYVIRATSPAASGSCQGPATNVVVTVLPKPSISSALTATVCSGSAFNYTITSNVSGASFAWTRATIAGISNAAGSGSTSSISETLVNTTGSPVNVTYVLTPTGPAPDNCPGTASNLVVTVNPKPTITSSDNEEVCSGVVFNYTITSNVANSTFTWSRSTTPNISNAAANGSTATINETLINTSTPSVPVNVTYVLTPTGPASTGSCVGDPEILVVEVQPAARITSSLDEEVCSGTSFSYTMTSDIAGSTFTWSRATVAGISNAAANGTGATFNETLTNTTNSDIVVIYALTPTGPTAGGCTGITSQLEVTVKPIPSISNNTQSICSGETASLNPVANVAGTTFAWTASNTSGSVTGFSASGTGNISETLTNGGTTVGTVTYVITPSKNGCDGNTANFVVTVNPTPAINSTLTGTVCSGNAFNYTITSNVTNSTFTWVRGAVTGISNAAGSGTTASINETLINTTSDPINVSYALSPTGPAPSSCAGTPAVLVVTVNPVPAITSSDEEEVCSNSAFAYTITSNVTGATFSWSRASVAGISNAAATGTSASINETLVNTTNDQVVVTYRITPSANGCAGTPFDLDITVKPVPSVTATPTTETICSTTATNINLSSNVSGTTFAWTVVANGGITGASDGSGNLITQTLTNSGAANTVVYTITPTADGCIGTSTSVKVTVDPCPLIADFNINKNQVCVDNSTILITDNSTGATGWSWDFGPDATPATANTQGPHSVTYSTPGLKTITLTVTGVGGPKSKPKTVNVIGLPVASANPNPETICSGELTSITLTSSVSNTTFTWTQTATGGVTGSSDGSGASIAQQLTNPGNTSGVVTYTVTPEADGCPGDPITIPVTVNPIPVATVAPTSQPLCSGDEANITFSSNVAGTTFAWTHTMTGPVNGAADGSGSSISQTLSNSDLSSQTVVYTITPTANGCPGAPVNSTVIVNPDVVATPASDNICSGETTDIMLTSNIAGTTFSWTHSVIGTVTGASDASGSTIAQTLTNGGNTNATVTYTVTPTYNTCNGAPINVVIGVYPQTSVSVSDPTITICTNNSTNINLSSPVSGTSFAWTVVANGVTGASDGSGSIINQTLVNSTNDPIDVVYTVTPTANGCDGTPSTITVTVDPCLLNPDFVANVTSVCLSNSTVIFTDQSFGATSWSWSFGAGANPATATGQGPHQVSYLTAGKKDVSLTVTGASGTKTESKTEYITVTANPNVRTLADKQICSGSSTDINIESDFAGTTFSWIASPSAGLSGASNGSGTYLNQSLTLQGATSGSVSYTITPDLNGCTGDDEVVEVTVNPNPRITSDPVRTICSNEQLTYTIESNVAGTTFNWSRPASIPGISATGLFSGNGSGISETLTNLTDDPIVVKYSIIPTGPSASNSCLGTPFELSVTVNPTPRVVVSTSPSVCSEAIFSYDIQGVGNISDYVWVREEVPGISNMAVQGMSSTIIEILNNTTKDPITVTYLITPIGTLSCEGDEEQLLVTVNPKPKIQTDPQSDAVCPGGTINFNVTAFAATNFQWQIRNANGQYDNLTNDAVYSGVHTHTLTLTGVTEVMDQHQYRCVVSGACGSSVIDASAVATLTVHQLPTPVLPAQFVDVCPNTPLILTPGTFNNVTYVWEKNDTGIIGETNDTLAFNATEDAVYTVTVTHTICGAADPVSTNINVIKYVAIDMRTADSCMDYSATLTPIKTGTQTVDEFVWTIGTSTYSTSSNSPELTYMFYSMGLHPVMIEAFYKGCPIGDTLINVVMNDCSIKLTNTFTPNGDGVNDTWHIPNMHNYPNATVQIFNRWGEFVYETSSGYVEEWDGTRNGVKCEEGVYYFVITLNKDNESGDNTGVYKGSLTLLR